jgi:hypothetical protein
MENLDAHLNSFASRCFRDVADRDYISARMNYRAGLISQFHWAASQAFEKYFKAILLYNRIKAKDIGHDLAKAKDYVQQAPFTIRLSDTSIKLIDHLNDCGRFRYLEVSYFSVGPALVALDKAVWELRRYCRVMNDPVPHSISHTGSLLELEIQRNESAAEQHPQKFHISGGLLEKILEKKDDPARAALIWQNGFYGGSRRTRVTAKKYFYAENSPLSLHPQILDHVCEFIFLPKEVREAYRNSALTQNASQRHA